MAETKYGKYVVKSPVAPLKEGLAPVLKFGLAKACGVNMLASVKPILKPQLEISMPHRHDFDQILCFFGSNPTDIGEDLGAEIELSLGEEGETHIITTPTTVYIPKGLIHCPLNFKRVDKPVYFLGIFMTGEYIREPPPENL